MLVKHIPLLKSGFHATAPEVLMSRIPLNPTTLVDSSPSPCDTTISALVSRPLKGRRSVTHDGPGNRNRIDSSGSTAMIDSRETSTSPTDTVAGPTRSFGWTTSPEHHARGGQIVLVPTGSVEQHGPHLPVATDIWIATAIAEQVARERPEVWLAEPISYGCSGHHTGFAGTLTLRVPTFIAVIEDVGSSIARDGGIPIFVNGHGGNRGPLSAALQALLDVGISAWAVSYFELLAGDIHDLFTDAHSAVGHACAMETSIMAHLWPKAVHSDLLPGPSAAGAWPDPFLYPGHHIVHHRRFEQLDALGVVGDPSQASPEAGARLFQSAVRELGAVVDRIDRQRGAKTAGRGTEHGAAGRASHRN
jgi:creatinine amidohydrolase